MLRPRLAGPGGQDDRYHPFTISQLKNFELALRNYPIKKGIMNQKEAWRPSHSAMSKRNNSTLRKFMDTSASNHLELAEPRKAYQDKFKEKNMN